MYNAKRRKTGALIAAAAITASAWTEPAGAALRSWDNPSGGTFNTGSNWTGNVAPGSADAAVFALDAVYPVAFPTNVTNDQLLVRDGSITFNLGSSGTPRTYALANAVQASIILGQNSGEFGRVAVNGGTLSGNLAVVGFTAGSSGQLTVDSTATLSLATQLRLASGGTSSIGTVRLNGTARAPDLTVGLAGRATMDIGFGVAGGLAEIDDDVIIGDFAGSNGSLTIGVDARLLANGATSRIAVGDQGSGTLTIGTLSVVQTSGNLDVAFGAGSRGYVTLNGNNGSLSVGGMMNIGGNAAAAGGSANFHHSRGAVNVAGGTKVWNGGNLFLNDGTFTTTRLDVVGGRVDYSAVNDLNLATGVIHVSGGGAFNHTAGTFTFAGHDITITDPGSVWDHHVNLRFEFGGGSTMRVLAGGTLLADPNSSVGAQIGVASGAGTIVVDGAGSAFNTDGITLGVNGDGTLTISNGATANASFNSAVSTVIGLNRAGTVLVTGPGSRLMGAGLAVGSSGGLSDGVLSVGDGGQVDSTSGSIAPFTSASGTVTVGSATSAKSVWTINGPLTVGGSLSTGRVTVNDGGIVRVTGATNFIDGQLFVDEFGRMEISSLGTGTTSQGFVIGAGSGGAGSMTTSGDVTSNTFVVVASGVGSAGTLSLLNGASFAANETLSVGERGVGTVLLGAGAALLSGGTMTVGSGTLGTGFVSLIGASSLTVGGLFRLGAGSGAVADLLIGSGGRLTTAQPALLAELTGSITRASVNGSGRWDANGGLFVGGGVGAPRGDATLTIGGGTVNVTGTLKVWDRGLMLYQAGSLNVAGTLDVTGGGRVVLTPAPLQKVLRTGALLVNSSAGSRVDLADHAMVIDYAAATPIDSIASLIRDGYASGAWTGNGLTSSSAAANANFGLGYAEASALSPVPAVFGSVDSTAVLVRYTRYGDANLDGQVNLNDFNRLASNFGATGAHWHQGDFTYDRIVNLADFNRLAANFGLSAAGPEVTPVDWANLAAAVPEPANAVGVALLVSFLTRGRQRRR